MNFYTNQIRNIDDIIVKLIIVKILSNDHRCFNYRKVRLGFFDLYICSFVLTRFKQTSNNRDHIFHDYIAPLISVQAHRSVFFLDATRRNKKKKTSGQQNLRVREGRVAREQFIWAVRGKETRVERERRRGQSFNCKATPPPPLRSRDSGLLWRRTTGIWLKEAEEYR